MSDDSLISVNWDQFSGEIGALIQRFAMLPRHIAKKHIGAAMKRALRPGVPALKAATPKQKTRLILGRNKSTGEYTARKMKGGALRRAATAKSKYVGTNKNGTHVGVLGYKFGMESRKAIWLEFGTEHIEPRLIVRGVMQTFGPKARAALATEMAAALEKAATELNSGKAVGSDYRRKR
jgi:HK97 gp10 family phage protein